MQFTSRMEALMKVAAGGAAVTASNAAISSVVATVPAADYFMSSSGLLSSLTSTLQTQLNNNVQGYPTAALIMSAAVNYGDWVGSAGYLFNESSGNAVPTFGAPALTPVNTPTYGFAGPRGGIDKAIGFDGTTDAFTGGNVNNLIAGTDLLVAGSIYFDGLDGASNDDIISKGFIGGAGAGYYICREGAQLSCYLADGANTVRVTVAVPASTWLAFILVADRTNQTMRIAVAPIATGVATSSASSSIAAVGSPSNANSFNVGNNGTNGALTGYLSSMYVLAAAGKAGTLVANLPAAVSNLANAINASWAVSFGSDGRVSIGWTGYLTPTWSLTWTNTTLRDVLGFTANIAGVTTTQTGTKQCRGVWYPDSPIFVAESDPRLAPVGNDGRSSVHGDGEVITFISGVQHRIHRSVKWPHIPITRIREQSATYANASWRTFWDDTQLCRGGISWFQPGSPLLIIDERGQVLGQDMQAGGPSLGWQVIDPGRVEPKRVDPQGWDGYWSIEFPEVIARDS